MAFNDGNAYFDVTKSITFAKMGNVPSKNIGFFINESLCFCNFLNKFIWIVSFVAFAD